MPYLRLSYTDRSGSVHPDAIFEIVALHLEMRRDGVACDIQLSGFHDSASRNNGLVPFEERAPTPLTEQEIAMLAGQFATAVYQVLQQRPEFSAAQVVP